MKQERYFIFEKMCAVSLWLDISKLYDGDVMICVHHVLKDFVKSPQGIMRRGIVMIY